MWLISDACWSTCRLEDTRRIIRNYLKYIGIHCIYDPVGILGDRYFLLELALNLMTNKIILTINEKNMRS